MTVKEALDYLTALWESGNITVNEAMALGMAIEALEQQKTAHWIDSKDWIEKRFDLMNFKKRCSLCNGRGFIQDKFCPNCGAKMEVKNEDSN